MRHACLLLLIGWLLSGCGVPQTPEAFNATPEAQFLRTVVDRLFAHDFASIEAQLDPQVPQADVRAALERTVAALPLQAVSTVSPVAWHVFVGTGGPRIATLSAEYNYGSSGWFLISGQLTGQPGRFRIRSFNVEPLPAPMAELHAFTLRGKGTTHYLFLALALSSFALCVFAFIRCLRTKGIHRKWLWALFTVVGFCAFTLNWTSGAVSVNPLSFNLFSAAFFRRGWVGPWNITFCLPIGAIIFLWKHGKIPSDELAEADRPPDSTVTTDKVRRAFMGFLWFIVIWIGSRLLVGGLIGAIVGAGRAGFVEGYAAGQAVSAAFFNDYGWLFLAFSIVIAVLLFGYLPGTKAKVPGH